MSGVTISCSSIINITDSDAKTNCDLTKITTTDSNKPFTIKDVANNDITFTGNSAIFKVGTTYKINSVISASASIVSGMTIIGTGNLTITDLHSNLSADLSNISIDNADASGRGLLQEIIRSKDKVLSCSERLVLLLVIV